MTQNEILQLVDLPRNERIMRVTMLRVQGQMSEQEYYEVFRPALEAKRGIVRDVNKHNEPGKIVRSKEWLEQRISYLKEKKEDCQHRLENIDAEIKQRQKEFKVK